MKKYIASMLILLPMLVVGCKNELSPEEVAVNKDGMTFSVILPETKSHFEGDSPQLYWDSSDRIAVYGVSIVDALMTDSHYINAVSEAMDIDEIAANGISATFSSSRSKASWFTTPSQTFQGMEDYYQFMAYYPCSGDPAAVSVYTTEDDRSYQYFPVEIPTTQDGRSIGSYQIMFDPGLTENENDDLSGVLTSKTSVMNNESQVNLTRFAPVNAMLRFSLALPASTPGVTLSSLSISLVDDPDNHSIAGPSMLTFFQYGNQDTTPVAWNKSSGQDYLMTVATGNNTISISEPPSVSDTPGDYLYAVVLPFKTSSADPKLKFQAMDSEGNEYSAIHELPTWTGEHNTDIFYGFQEGHRYKTDIVLQPEEDPMLGVPLTLEALENGTTVTVANSAGLPVFQYSTDNQNWTTTTGGENSVTISLNEGECVYLKGDNATYYISSNPTTILPDKACYIYGNIMSLVDSEDFKNCTEITGTNAFSRMFSSANIQNHQTKKLLLPATTLTNSCYEQMFSGCTSLTAAPELPATELADYCYSYMFNVCTSLTAAPELPATTLARYCYRYMFNRCTSLTTAPELPATRLANNCYEGMFTSCTSLTTAPELPATRLAGNCYSRMFDRCSHLNYVKCLASVIPSGSTTGWLYGVSSEGTFVKNASVTWGTGASGIPEGWTVEGATN